MPLVFTVSEDIRLFKFIRYIEPDICEAAYWTLQGGVIPDCPGAYVVNKQNRSTSPRRSGGPGIRAPASCSARDIGAWRWRGRVTPESTAPWLRPQSSPAGGLNWEWQYLANGGVMLHPSTWLEYDQEEDVADWAKQAGSTSPGRCVSYQYQEEVQG
ncbi:MAG: hypothetical protein M3305_07015 [Actinomycetota bacterium]|nr:hypothetical protein [Actinomycetota bacterium]